LNWVLLVLIALPVILVIPVRWTFLVSISRRQQDGWLDHWHVIDYANQNHKSKTGKLLLPTSFMFAAGAAVVTQLLWLLVDIVAIYGVWLAIDDRPNWWFGIVWYIYLSTRAASFLLVLKTISNDPSHEKRSQAKKIALYTYGFIVVIFQPLVGVPRLVFRLAMSPMERLVTGEQSVTRVRWFAWLVLVAIAVVSYKLATEE